MQTYPTALSDGPLPGGARRAVHRLVYAGVVAAVLAAFGIISLSARSASASTSYVVDNTAANCSDSGPGSSSQAFCTIAAAAKAAHAGDTVTVRAGTYAGTAVNPANSGAAGSPITFTASPGVTVSGGTKAFALSSRNYIVISGFTITATSSAGISISNGANDTVSNDVITGTGSYGISVSGGSAENLTGNTESFAGYPVSSPAAGIYLSNLNGGLVQGNTTHDNSAHGIYLTGSTTGVLVSGNTSYRNAYQYVRNANGIDDIAPANSIIGNVTYDNEDTGINIYPGGNNALVANNVTYGNGDHGIDDYNVTGGRIINNTVYGNCTDGINVEGTSANYTIENNVSMNNATGAVINPTPIAETNGKPDYTNLCNRRVGNIGVYDSAPATSAADYNLVWQSGAGAEYSWAGTTYSTQQALHAATGQEQHGIFSDPQFANAGAADFQLTAASPAIDQANTSVSGHQPADILGASPFDDLGAYEYTSSGTPTGPAAALTVSPASGPAPLTVTADASGSAAGSSPISSYTFSFGDGTTVGPQPGPTASHVYQQAGSYQVTVTATDGNGMTGQATQAVSVGSTAGPVAKYVNQIATNYSTSPHTSGYVTVWRAGGVGAGDLIIATVQLTGTSATATVSGTDTAGDVLSVESDVTDGSGDRLVTLAGVATGGLAVNDQVVLSFPSAATYRITADEVAGVTATDVMASASGSGSAFSSGATGTTTRAGEFVYAAVATFGGTSLSWGTGWTGLTTYSAGSGALGRAYQIPSSTGTFTGTGTASGAWLAEVIAFR
jgi:parallel beta-helix repeat protein